MIRQVFKIILLTSTNCLFFITPNEGECQTFEDTRFPCAQGRDESACFRFLDSIERLNPEDIKKAAGYLTDSIFHALIPLDKHLDSADFCLLKEAFQQEDVRFFGPRISLEDAMRIFPFKLDSLAITDSMLGMGLFSFNPDTFAFDAWAVCIGSVHFLERNDLYFFKGDHLIAWHRNYSRYGIELNYFITADGNPTIYYKENFGSGTGIWHFNYYFYRYSQDSLLPVLNILENGNLNHWGTPREFWLETFVMNTSPLVFKFVYHTEFVDSSYQRIEMINDSLLVPFLFDAALKRYIGQYPPDFSESEILTYYLDCPELYFVRVMNRRFRAWLCGNDQQKRGAAIQYLNRLQGN